MTAGAHAPSKYEGSEATAKKFDAVPAEYKGEAIAVTLDMLHWRARRRAENVIRAVYFPKIGPIAEAFKTLPIENLGADLICPKGGEPIPPGTVGPKDGLTALEYLLFCWSERALEGLKIPPNVLEEARGSTQARRERIDLGGRRLHIWNGGDLAAGTEALVADILASDTKFFCYDKENDVPVRLSSPTSDPTAAARIRELHGYKGNPGDPKDPARGKGMRLIPVLSTDTKTMRRYIAKHIAIKKTVKIGKIERKIICSPAFKSNASILQEPDAGVLEDIIKHAMSEQAPGIKNVISAPLMLHLPASTRPEDLLRPDAATSTQNHQGQRGADEHTLATPLAWPRRRSRAAQSRVCPS